MKRLKTDTIIGIIFVLIAGTLAHFVYGWTGETRAVGYFFPVSESTWEHMKLCFFPMLVYSVYTQRRNIRDCPCVTSALAAGILTATYAVPVVFYTYSGILGKDCFVLDIATFVVSVLAGFAVTYKLTVSCRADKYGILLKWLVLITGVCFVAFTYSPPSLDIFADPL